MSENNYDGTKKPTFQYFGYGSNLLGKRIQMQDSSAVRIGPGILKNYRLDFSTTHSGRWGGSSCTIVEDDGNEVWGAIWDIDAEKLKSLDEQEGVLSGLYRALDVTIETQHKETYICRTYQCVNSPKPNEHGGKPSRTYLGIIVAGSIESELPEDYVKRVKLIEHNGQQAGEKIMKIFGEDYDNYV